MKRLTATILSVCFGTAGLTDCQARASETPATPNRTIDTDQQQAEKEPKEKTKSRGDPAGEPDASQPGDTVIMTDHADSQVEIPKEVDRAVVTGILPLPSIIAVSLGSGEKIVGMAPASMSTVRTGLLGKLFPDILNASTDFMSGSDINMGELAKLEPDVVFYNAGSKEIRGALCSAGFMAVVASVDKWNCDSIETYDQWISLSSQTFPEEGDAAGQASRYSRNIYEDIQNKVSGLKDEKKKDIPFLLNYSDTTMAISDKKFFDQFQCDTVEGRNAAEGVAAENSDVVINIEQAYEQNPDITFITNSTPVQPKDFYENAVGQGDWSPVKAVQDKNAYKLSFGTYRSYTPSTDTPTTLLWMAEQIYLDLFLGVGMTQEVKDYYKELHGVDLNGEQVRRMYHLGREAAAGYKK